MVVSVSGKLKMHLLALIGVIAALIIKRMNICTIQTSRKALMMINDNYSDVSYQTRVVTFKKVSMINDKSTVSVELCPESDNPYDSRQLLL